MPRFSRPGCSSSRIRRSRAANDRAIALLRSVDPSSTRSSSQSVVLREDARDRVREEALLVEEDHHDRRARARQGSRLWSI